MVAIQFIYLSVEVLYCTWGSSLTWQERSLLAWIAPRGIVAAEVSALFAIKLEQRNFEQAEAAAPLTSAVTGRHLRGPAKSDLRMDRPQAGRPNPLRPVS